MRKNGSVALATLLQYSATELQRLSIANTDIDDEGIEAFVPALTNCFHLQELWLSGNPTITTKGWQSFATILEASNSNLGRLGVQLNRIDDEAVTAFANALTSNHTL